QLRRQRQMCIRDRCKCGRIILKGVKKLFLITEIGSLIKIIGSVLAYILFIPINLLDKYFISRILFEQSSSKTLALVVVLIFFFVALGLLMRSVVLIIKVGAIILSVYLLSDFLIGLLFFSLCFFLLKEWWKSAT
ncbi:hypothetical protein KQJ29_18655, partial [Enterococcus sp. S181_ASV_20]|nr:hypothetical protein [Enterococcus sp. S181_ASV_20]